MYESPQKKLCDAPARLIAKTQTHTMTHVSVRRASATGFTLTELLVTIAIIAVLATLVFTLARNLTRQAAATRDSNTMRQMWTCILMYAGDQNDLMPGPMFSRQSPVYNKPIPKNTRDWRRLSDCLAGYLGHENPKKGDFIPAMAASWQKTPESWQYPGFFMQHKLPVGDGLSTDSPWGEPAPASGEDRLPMRLSAVMSQPNIERTWAMTETDSLHPSLQGHPGLPEGMAHGRYRLGIFFDGSVRKLDANNEPF